MSDSSGIWHPGPGTFVIEFACPATYAALVSIVTKTGDDGTTSLMYGRRVPKFDLQVQACGTVDELNSALGLARATARDARVHELLQSIQKELIVLMGELMTVPEDLPRYLKDGFSSVTPAMTQRLESEVARIEPGVTLKGWATPGGEIHSAALDLARSICRRAERQICELRAAGRINNGEIIIFVNRLADLLWLIARQADASPATKAVS